MMPLCVFLVAAGAFPLVCPAAEPAAEPSIEALPTALTLPLGLPAGTKPLELVRLRGSGTSQAFLTARNEVTQAQHEAVVGRSPSEFKSVADCPVENVIWDETKAFCKKLTPMRTSAFKGKGAFRLPTDAAWSMAVGLPVERGALPRKRPSRSRTRFRGARNGHHSAAPGISTTRPRGNLWKWCEDWYDGKRDTRVSRGASWRMGARDRLLFSCRLDGSPEARGDYVGFRVVLALAAPKSKTERGKLHVCGE